MMVLSVSRGLAVCRYAIFQPAHFSIRACSTPAPNPPTTIDEAYISSDKIDVEKLFLSKPVRSLLHQLTGLDLERIFAYRRKEYKVPEYKLLTDEQLRDELLNAVAKAKEMIQMPPVLRRREPCDKVLRRDPEIQGYGEHNFVFTDISFGHSDRERPIVVREPDGVLRTANWKERERMVQIYFTNKNRELEVPPMFTEPHLTVALDKKWYKFVLDRACMQFEPDSEYYLGVTQRAYEHLNETGDFDSLRSTRHFGPMCLYYAVSKKSDPLMLKLITEDRIDDAANFVKLLHQVHPDTLSRQKISDECSSVDFVEAYISFDSQTQLKPRMELVMQSYRMQQKAAAQASK